MPALIIIFLIFVSRSQNMTLPFPLYPHPNKRHSLTHLPFLHSLWTCVLFLFIQNTVSTYWNCILSPPFLYVNNMIITFSLKIIFKQTKRKQCSLFFTPIPVWASYSQLTTGMTTTDRFLSQVKKPISMAYLFLFSFALFSLLSPPQPSILICLNSLFLNLNLNAFFYTYHFPYHQEISNTLKHYYLEDSRNPVPDIHPGFIPARLRSQFACLLPTMLLASEQLEFWLV